MAMSQGLRKLIHLFGSVLALAGVFFVFLRINEYLEQFDFSRLDAAEWIMVVGLVFIYGVANVLLARAWWQLLILFGVQTKAHWAIRAYGLSQLAKYVPGNIFHLAGRQALGMAAGLKSGPLAKSTLWELVLISFVGMLFGVLILPLLWSELSPYMSYLLFGLAVVALITVLNYRFSRSVVLAVIWQFVFLAVSGWVFVATLLLIVSETGSIPALPLLCGAYVIAWLAGLVTPGAPAGIGVREVVLLFLLGGIVAPADLLLAVLLGRVVTVLGDLFFFVASVFLKRIDVNESY